MLVCASVAFAHPYFSLVIPVLGWLTKQKNVTVHRQGDYKSFKNLAYTQETS